MYKNLCKYCEPANSCTMSALSGSIPLFAFIPRREASGAYGETGLSRKALRVFFMNIKKTPAFSAENASAVELADGIARLRRAYDVAHLLFAQVPGSYTHLKMCIQHIFLRLVPFRVQFRLKIKKDFDFHQSLSGAGGRN